MAPATEVVFLPLKEGVIGGQKYNEMLQLISSQDGCQSIFAGQQIEHPTVGTLLINWDSVGHHEKFIASP